MSFRPLLLVAAALLAVRAPAPAGATTVTADGWSATCGARLKQTQFVGCSFDGVDFRGVDLSETRMVGVDLSSARFQ